MNKSSIKIVISYRAVDTKLIIGRIHERLRKVFGNENVFLDFEGIAGSADYRNSIRQALDQCNVLVAVVGPQWFGPLDHNANPILFNPSDWVHLEVATALAAGKQVVPVLLDNTRMPNPKELPVPMRDFAYRQGVRLSSGREFDLHMDQVIRVIQQAWGETPENMKKRALAESVFREENQLASAIFFVCLPLWIIFAVAAHFDWFQFPDAGLHRLLLFALVFLGPPVLLVTRMVWRQNRAERPYDRKMQGED